MQTKWAHLAGTSDVFWRVQYMTPLDDPEEWGNCGAQGFDDSGEHGEERDLGTAKAAAIAKADELAKAGNIVVDLQLYERDWERETIPDREYGDVEHAEPIEKWQHYGCWSDGAVTWDERQSVNI